MPQPFQRKPKKKLIQVAGTPLTTRPVAPAAIKPGPNKEMVNPLTESLDWGYFPKIDRPDAPFEAGPIRLRYGVHYGPNRGYGLEHIWAAHFQNADPALNTPILALPAVAAFLGTILQPGAAILYEYGLGPSGKRTTIFKSSKGTAIVEARVDGQGIAVYSIITVFRGRNGHGAVIGSL